MSPTDTTAFPKPQAWDVEPDPAAVPPARHLIRGIAEAWQVPLSDDALRDVELCADELLANAIEHTKNLCRVTVRWTGERLRVEVAASSLRLPDQDSAEDTVTGGRGLVLVEELSHSWGWYLAEAGKVVWFEVAADQLVTGDLRLAVLVHAAQARTTAQLAQPA